MAHDDGNRDGRPDLSGRLARARCGGDGMAVLPCAGKPDASGVVVHLQGHRSMTGTTVCLSVASSPAASGRLPGQGGGAQVPRTGILDGR